MCLEFTFPLRKYTKKIISPTKQTIKFLPETLKTYIQHTFVFYRGHVPEMRRQ